MQAVNSQNSNARWLIWFIVLLPLISALSAHFMSRNALLLVYLLVGLTVFAAGLSLEVAFADLFFPVLIGAVALSLLLSSTLSSPYVTGFDAPQEFALFQQIVQQGSWQPQVSILYNAALSVTILPYVITTVSSLDGILIFKVVYPFLFSLVPMILYKIFRRIISPEAAFLSVFVFLSYPESYLGITQLYREMIAELIMVLLLWIQFFPRLRRVRATSIFLLLLTLGVVISHYTTALIYVLLVSLAYLASRIPRLRIESTGRSPAIAIVVSLGWFFFVAGGVVMQNLLQTLAFVNEGLTELFTPGTRPYEITAALGLGPLNLGALHVVNRATQYLVVFCITLGFLVYVWKRRKTNAENMLVPFMVVSMGFLIASFVIPYLAGTLQLSRIYGFALFFLAPCFYFGAAKITGGLRRLGSYVARRPIRIRIGRLAPAAILFCYLIFTSGWVWAITLDQPSSPVLDQERMATSSDRSTQLGYHTWYTLAEDIAAARWISSQGAAQGQVCSDKLSEFHVLNAYGGYERAGLTFGYACFHTFTTEYLYLSTANSILGVEYIGTRSPSTFYPFSLNETMPILLAKNRIYSDGAAIYESS